VSGFIKPFQTYAAVNFAYLDSSKRLHQVTTLEEQEYPHYYHQLVDNDDKNGDLFQTNQSSILSANNAAQIASNAAESLLREKHITFQENQKGISFDYLFGPYLAGAKKVTVTDPYIRLFYQLRNFMEFLETIVRYKADDFEVEVHLITTEDDFKGELQRESLDKIAESCQTVGINFTWEFDQTGTIHARHIFTNHGWKISLDRGLDIYQNYEMKEAFTFSNRLQQYRACKAFEVTFIKFDESNPNFE